MANLVLPDMDITPLSAADLSRVVAWLQHRLNNGIMPLAVHIGRELPGVIRADPTLQAARHAVAVVQAVVSEAEAALAAARIREQG